MAERVQVKNAASRAQVKAAQRTEERLERETLVALRTVMGTPAGRRVLWELLERAGVYRSVWSDDVRIHYNAGRQDFGHELIALILNAGEALYLEMETEARARAAKEQRTTDAQHTASITEETPS